MLFLLATGDTQYSDPILCGCHLHAENSAEDNQRCIYFLNLFQSLSLSMLPAGTALRLRTFRNFKESYEKIVI